MKERERERQRERERERERESERERERQREKGGGVGKERQGETNRICIPNSCVYSLCLEVLHLTNAFLDLVDAN